MQRPKNQAPDASSKKQGAPPARPPKKRKSHGPNVIVYVVASLGFLGIMYLSMEPTVEAPHRRAAQTPPVQNHVRTKIPRTGATKALVQLQQERTEGGGEGQDRVLTYQVIAQMHHDSSAFTQGLEFLAGRFIESTGITSSLREVDIASGQAVRGKLLAKEHFGEGVTVFHGLVYQLTWRSGVCLVYDLETFEEVNRHTYDTQGWGITNDGTSLIMSDGSDRLFIRDPETFEITRTLNVKDNGKALPMVNELEYVHGEVLANIWHKDSVARISPDDGKVLGWIDLSGLHPQRSPTARGEDVLNGIAWDKYRDRLWVTGKLWPSMFEIELV